MNWSETEMLIVVIGARADDEVYQIAEKRARKKTALTQKEAARAASFFALFTYFFFGNTNGSCR